MSKVEKVKLIKTALLLISTTPCPLFMAIFLYVIPALYICFVVPYLIWKIWFGKYDYKTQKYSLIWKIPLIAFLAIALFIIEMLLVFFVPTTLSLLGKIAVFIIFLLMARCLTYAMMIFIWQSDILVPYRKLICAGIIAYCLVIADFLYSSQNAPDTDDYSIPFAEQF